MKLREESADRAVTDHTHVQPEENHSSNSRDHHPTTYFSTISNYLKRCGSSGGTDQVDIVNSVIVVRSAYRITRTSIRRRILRDRMLSHEAASARSSQSHIARLSNPA